MRRYWVIWMALLVAGITANGQEVSADLDHDAIKIGERATITFEVRVPAAAKVIVLPALEDTLSEKVEILEILEVDTTFVEDDISTKIFTQKVVVTTWDSGYHVIPPLAFVVDSDTLDTEAKLLEVKTVLIQAEQDIKDIKEIIDVPFSLIDWILKERKLIGSSLLLVILLVLGYFIYQKYFNKEEEERPSYVPKEAADILANKKRKALEESELG